MQLLPNFIRKQIPPIYSQQDKRDPLVVCKFFLPGVPWAWYVIEGEARPDEGQGKDFEFFGLVEGLEAELCYFSLSQLREAHGPLGVVIERDVYFKPRPLSQVRR
jgi:hypothetical protein